MLGLSYFLDFLYIFSEFKAFLGFLGFQVDFHLLNIALGSYFPCLFARLIVLTHANNLFNH
jgi:hypothetical protein